MTASPPFVSLTRLRGLLGRSTQRLPTARLRLVGILRAVQEAEAVVTPGPLVEERFQTTR